MGGMRRRLVLKVCDSRQTVTTSPGGQNTRGERKRSLGGLGANAGSVSAGPCFLERLHDCLEEPPHVMHAVTTHRMNSWCVHVKWGAEFVKHLDKGVREGGREGRREKGRKDGPGAH